MNMHDLTNQQLFEEFYNYRNDGVIDEMKTKFWQAFPSLADFKVAANQKKADLINEDLEFEHLFFGMELGMRAAREHRPLIGKIYSSQQVGDNLVQQFRDDVQESLVLFCLDVKHQIIAQQVIFKGTLNSCPVHPREIFSVALEHHAAGILVAHNHPSGDVQPSQNDIEFSRRLDQCSELMGITLVDSFILGDGDYLSMRESKVLEP